MSVASLGSPCDTMSLGLPPAPASFVFAAASGVGKGESFFGSPRISPPRNALTTPMKGLLKTPNSTSKRKSVCFVDKRNETAFFTRNDDPDFVPVSAAARVAALSMRVPVSVCVPVSVLVRSCACLCVCPRVPGLCAFPSARNTQTPHSILQTRLANAHSSSQTHT